MKDDDSLVPRITRRELLVQSALGTGLAMVAPYFVNAHSLVGGALVITLKI